MPQPTTIVAPPTRPPRRVDEATATFRHDGSPAELDEVRKRRLLGQEELDGVLDEERRKHFVLELTALYRHGHMEDVIAELEKIRSKFPNDVELHGMMADFFLERGDLPRATEMLFSMVSVHFERADTEAARRCLERISGLDPENKRLRRFDKLLHGS